MNKHLESWATFAAQSGRLDLNAPAIASARNAFLQREGLTADAARLLTSKERAALASRWKVSPEREDSFLDL